jgi:hypothetical protein
MKMTSLVLSTGVFVIAVSAARADAEYARAGWRAELSTRFHAVEGTVTIVDERTLQVDHFTYDGPAPAVYFYLGAEDTNIAFTNGLSVPPQLIRDYNDESLTLTLPAGETLDGYNAVSVWCADVRVNFGSGTFFPPGDFDEDGDTDLADYEVLGDCSAGPNLDPAPGATDMASCLAVFDFDEDGDVDLSDNAVFQDHYTGP